MIASEAQSVADTAVGPSRRSVRYWTGVFALGVMFLMVTKGPVFWVRLEIDFDVIRTGLVEDLWIQVAFVTSAAVVLAIAAPAARVVWADRLVAGSFVAFLVVVFVSSLWSIAPAHTVQQSSMFLIGSIAALVAGAYVRRFDALVALWLAMQVGVGVSIFAWVRDWPLVTQISGDLAGIYLNKNSLGPVAVVGGASSIALAAALLARRRWWPVPVALACAAVDGYVWWATYSLTPALSVFAAFAAVVLISLFVPGRSVIVRRVLGALMALLLVLVVWIAFGYLDQFNERLRRRSTLSGRTVIWDVVLEYSAERPVRGWGYQAIWTDSDIVDSLVARGRPPVFSAHSGFLEVLVGVGLIGLALLLIVVTVAVARVSAAMWRAPSVLTAWSFALVVFALAANATESFIGPNELPWTMICVAVGQAVVVRQELAARHPVAPSEEIVYHAEIGHEVVDVLVDEDTPVHIDPLIDLAATNQFDFSFDVPLDDPPPRRDDAFADDEHDDRPPRTTGAFADDRTDGDPPRRTGAFADDRTDDDRDFDDDDRADRLDDDDRDNDRADRNARADRADRDGIAGDPRRRGGVFPDDHTGDEFGVMR